MVFVIFIVHLLIIICGHTILVFPEIKVDFVNVFSIFFLRCNKSLLNFISVMLNKQAKYKELIN